MRRRISRQKKTGIVFAGLGIAAGLAAVIFWPKIKRKFFTVKTGGPIKFARKSSTGQVDAYTPGSPLNRAINEWYEKNPDVPLINEDGTWNPLFES